MHVHLISSPSDSIRATNFALRCARAGTLRGLSTQFWLASCRSSSLIRSPACNSEVWQGRANAANIQFIGLIWFDMVWYGLIWFDMVWYGLIWFDSAQWQFHQAMALSNRQMSSEDSWRSRHGCLGPGCSWPPENLMKAKCSWLIYQKISPTKRSAFDKAGMLRVGSCSAVSILCVALSHNEAHNATDPDFVQLFPELMEPPERCQVDPNVFLLAKRQAVRWRFLGYPIEWHLSFNVFKIQALK